MNKRKTKTIGFAVLGSLALIGGATTVISCNNGGSQEVVINYQAIIDPTSASNTKIDKQGKLSDGSYEIILSCTSETKKFADVAVNIGSTNLVNNTDFTFDSTSGRILIKKETLDKNKTTGEITVKPSLYNLKAKIGWYYRFDIPYIGESKTPKELAKGSTEIYFGKKADYNLKDKNIVYSVDIGRTTEDRITAYIEQVETASNSNTFEKHLYILSDEVISFSNDDTGDYEYYGLLDHCTNLRSITFDNVDFSQCIKFQHFFDGDTNLTTINGLDKIDFSNAEYVYYFFQDCSKLTTLDLSNLNLGKVKSVGYMFDGCTSLEEIKLPASLTLESTTDGNCLVYMFYNCTKLKEIDLSNLQPNTITGLYSMFNGCSALTTIYVTKDKFEPYSISDTNSSNMFYNCTSLVGGNATACDGTNNITASYARIDTESNPGYFTAKE